jgi:hypothetical protein
MAVEKQRSASGSQTPVFLLKSLDFDSKKLLDMFFVVPGNRLFLASNRIEIDVVPSAMPQQDATLPK